MYSLSHLKTNRVQTLFMQSSYKNNLIIYLILLPFSMQRIEITGTDNLTGRILIETQTLSENNPNGLELKLSLIHI